MDEPAILDASPIILLARAGFLNFLRVLHRPLVVPLQARRCAEWLQIPTSGTIGIVLRAKSTGLVDAARPVLQRLISVGMYLSERTLNAILLRVGE